MFITNFLRVCRLPPVLTMDLPWLLIAVIGFTATIVCCQPVNDSDDPTSVPPKGISIISLLVFCVCVRACVYLVRSRERNIVARRFFYQHEELRLASCTDCFASWYNAWFERKKTTPSTIQSCCQRRVRPRNSWSLGPKFSRKVGPRVYVLGFKVCV